MLALAKKLRAWWQAHGPTRRRLIQVYAALLFNAHTRGFIEGEIYVGPLKNGCVPGLNCYSCPGAIGACPLGALQNALASSATRAPHYIFGILLLFGLTLGRTICAFLCPLGLIQELIHKIPVPKLGKNRFTRVLSYLKYVILAVFVCGIELVYGAQQFPVPAFCKYICPAGTLEGAIGLLSNPVNAPKFALLNILFARKFVIMVVIFAACAFIYRAFCRFLCPLGAIYGLFDRVALLGIKVNPAQCTHCGRCVARCKMDIRRVGDHECIHCGECLSACPTGAIAWHAGKITLFANETGKETGKKRGKAPSLLAWGVAIALLLGVGWAVHLPATPSAGDTGALEQALSGADPDTPVGFEVGMRCPDFTIPLYGAPGGELTLSETLGKPVVINFWATWCTPCCAELPHFQAIYEKYGEQLTLVAIHSHLVTDDVRAYLDAQGYTMPFGLDQTGAIIQSLGGSTMLPMTVIVDKAGKIVYNQVGSLTLQALESLVAPLI